MAIVLKDRVKESTATSGTGTITLIGAIAGYQSFDAIGDGSTTYYTIVDNEANDWEVGIGTYTALGRTLTRTTVLSSSNAGSLVNFSANTKDVFVTYPAEKAIYEEATGNVLIDGGPITVVGTGVTGYTTFSAALGEMYGNVNSFAQLYARNLNDGSEASADMIVYRDNTVSDDANFMDMGINSSNFSSATWPIFTPSSMYLYGDGGEMFIGSGTDDVVFFAGGVDTTDEAMRIDKTTKALTTVSDVNVGGTLNGVGAAFTSPVTTSSSMVSPSSNEFVTKAYVDNAASAGLTVHPAVRVEAVGNLNATYNNGVAGVGATLTNAGAQAALVLDGVTLSVNDRVLVMDQTNQTQNGVYVVSDVGSGSTNWVLTRASDADTYGVNNPDALDEGAYFFVQEGATAAFESYTCTTTGVIVFGTTNITFSQFSSVPQYVVTSPLQLSGNTLSLNTVPATLGGTGTATVATGDLLYGSATNTWAKLGIGSAYKTLVVNAAGTNVEWNAVALNQSGAVSGTLPTTNGGTGLNGYTLGDIVYSSATDTLGKLAGNTTTTKLFLTQTGTGSGSAAPAWGAISGSDVSGNISGQAGSVANALTAGTYLTSGGTYNGSAARTFAVDATDANTASKVVARDASGNFSAGTITATLNGAATSATTATNVAGGAANRIVYNTGAGATGFVAAPAASSTYMYWDGAAFQWGTVVSSATAGTGVSVSASSGAVTFSIGQAVATSSNVQFNSLGVGTAGSGTAGEIRATNNITGYYSSDIKFKENVRDIPNALATATAIGGKLFDWKDSYIQEKGGADGYFVQKQDFGVIAQDVQKVFPVAVRTRPDGSLAVDYEKLGALAFAALVELAKRVEVLEAK